MSLETKDRNSFLELRQMLQIESSATRDLFDEVTRALEPTHSEEIRSLIIEKLHILQKLLNKRKNIYSKILKELLKSTN